MKVDTVCEGLESSECKRFDILYTDKVRTKNHRLGGDFLLMWQKVLDILQVLML